MIRIEIWNSIFEALELKFGIWHSRFEIRNTCEIRDGNFDIWGSKYGIRKLESKLIIRIPKFEIYNDKIPNFKFEEWNWKLEKSIIKIRNSIFVFFWELENYFYIWFYFLLGYRYKIFFILEYNFFVIMI